MHPKLPSSSLRGTCALLSLAVLSPLAQAQEKLSPFSPLLTNTKKTNKNDFLLATTKAAAPIYLDANDFPVVRIAADALAGDIQSVTTAQSKVSSTAPTAGDTAVFVGTLGKSKLIDDLVAAKKINVAAIRGQWERYIITTVDNPVPGVRQGLVIIGSDRRGTAYGAFSVSEAIGVSPWVWWADVTPTRRDSLVISRANYTSKSPSVKYRGIFINDEDWGLNPWSKKFEPEVNTIGPKTYAKVGELLLRLKANYLWPAMHEVTVAFNQIPENKVVMDKYAIVMGASHAEPMLFNNATEWKYPKNQWNYETNSDLIKGVWKKRVQENAQYENSYTVGIRGIHDSPMQGGGTTQDGVRRLERVIADQRALLSKYLNPKLDQISQIFVPYKEVLPYYQAGMKVPDDVTLVWVDDNYGYIRQLSNPEEQKRQGRAGVYYHFSYYGSPQDFLWIGSTSPALTSYEMLKAKAYGADRLWVFNVGDIKPIEKEMEFAMRLAYDSDQYPVDKAMNFLADFANENFGAPYAKETAAILEEYYHLTAQAKPEHNDRMMMTSKEMDDRLAAYSALVKRTDALYAQIPAAKKDSFFQLVLYPVKGAALMNVKQTALRRGNTDEALQAYNGIEEISQRYNKGIAGGKWDGIMSFHPRDQRVFSRPTEGTGTGTPTGQTSAPLIQVDAKSAQLSGGMKLMDDAIVGAAPGLQVENNDNTARFTLNLPQAQKASIYFLAQTVDDKHDSWFVNLNGQKVVVNDQITGAQAGWIKVMDADLTAGQNSLTVSQREDGTALYQVAVMEPGKTPNPVKVKALNLGERTPQVVLAASNYSQIKNTATSKWQEVKGLGIEKSAMTLLPFQTQPIADAEKAPAITYTFQATGPQVSVETRFLPTHRVNPSVNLRYAISVDGGPAEIRDIENAEYAGDWSRNVLVGYARGTTNHTLKAGATHNITISLLDPGMVLSQIQVFGTP